MNDSKQTILIVDDISENIDVLNNILKEKYLIRVALNGEQALKIAAGNKPPDLILLDIMMPGIDGYEVCSRLKGNIATRNIPVVFVTTKGDVDDETKGFELGAVDYITKPVSPSLVKARVQTQLELYDQNRALEEKVRRRTEELNSTRLEIIHRLGLASEFRDNETGLHIVRVGYYSKLLAQAANLTEDHVEIIFNAAPMHDVGKIGIPDNVLLKPGKLEPEEWEIMKQHTTMGAHIIGNHESELLKMARVIALTHHEKWNGKGYPEGLKGEDIPIEGRILAIADVFDSLTSARPYKEAWTLEKTVNLINEETGEHFDPSLIKLFNKVLPQIIEIKEEYNDGDTV